MSAFQFCVFYTAIPTAFVKPECRLLLESVHTLSPITRHLYLPPLRGMSVEKKILAKAATWATQLDGFASNDDAICCFRAQPFGGRYMVFAVAALAYAR